MTVEGHIENGQIVLDTLLQIPDGTKVAVSIQPTEQVVSSEEELPTLYERMKSFIGSVEGLPPDFAINHDHYLYGQPKRQ